MKKKVNSIADVKVISDMNELRKSDSPLGKEFLRVTFENGDTVDMTLNLAEMIGAVGAGANIRFGYTQDNRRKH